MTAPIHVLQVLRGFEADGPGRLVLTLLRALDPGDVRVSAVGLRKAGPLRDAVEIEVRRLGGTVYTVDGGLRSVFRSARRIASIARASEVTHLHAHLPRADMVGREAARLLDCPYIVTEHGLHAWSEKGWWLRPAMRAWYCHRVPAGMRVAAISARVRRQLLAEGFPPGRVRVVENAIDTTRFHPASDSERAEARLRLAIPAGAGPVLLVVGSLVARKDPAVALRAFRRLRAGGQPDACLVYAGAGILRSRLTASATADGCGRAVVFAGQLDEPLLAYHAADLLVHPAKDEPFGLAVAEALACGLPVVARAGAGADELLPPAPLAGAAEGGSPVAWAAAIQELLERPGAIGADARARRRAWAGERFPAARMAAQYIDLYRESAGG